jgi:hypothetical protein
VTVVAFKFLGKGRVAPFGGFVWPEPDGEWVSAAGELSVCARGIHACRVSDLPHWIGEELWQIELGDPVAEHELMLVAERGRLTRPIAAWDESARQAFAGYCVTRVAHHASAELRSAELRDEAQAIDRAAAKSTPRELAAVADRAAAVAAVGGWRARHAGELAGYVADAVAWSADPAAVAYVAAHAADARSEPDDERDPFVVERGLQAEWLRTELKLEEA